MRPDARGTGVGKQLLPHLARIAVERGCGRMEWTVLNWNEPAIRLSQALGAEPLNTSTVFRLTDPSLATLAAVADPS